MGRLSNGKQPKRHAKLRASPRLSSFSSSHPFSLWIRVGSCTDVHTQHVALSESRTTQAQLHGLLEQAKITLWAVDTDARITTCHGPGAQNELLKDLSMERSRASGKRATEPQSTSSDSADRPVLAIGQNVFEVWLQPDITQAIKAAMNGTSTTEELEVRDRWFRIQYSTLRGQDGEVSCLSD